MKPAFFFVLLGLTLPLGQPVAAQVPDRGTALERARGEFDLDVALNVLLPIVDPQLAGPDSLWADGLSLFATSLFDLGNAGLAETWLRWGVRHGGQWSVDGLRYPSAVVEAFGAAEEAVVPDGETDGSVETGWLWPDAFDPLAPGRLAIDVPDDVGGLSLRLNGEAATVSDLEALPAGSYSLDLAFDGFEELAVQREVLPGVTTSLTVSPAPVLSDPVAERLQGRVGQLSATTVSGTVCSNVLVTGSTSLVAPASVGGQGGSFRVGAVSGTALPYTGAPGAGLSLFRADGGTGIVGIEYGLPRAGEWGWAVFREECQGVLQIERLKLLSVSDQEAVFDRSIPPAAIGGALVDDAGLILGLVTGQDRALLLTTQAQAALDRAILAMNEESQVTPGGGLPWKWIGGAGALGAGALAVLASGGGGDDPPPPPTGEIVGVVPVG